MKFLCAVLYVVTFIGLALGDEEAGAASAGGADTLASGGCDVHLGEHDNRTDVADVLMDRLLDCFHDEGSVINQAVNISHTTEEFRNIFKNACEKLPGLSECTAEVADNVHKCLNETDTKSFKVVRNDIETIMNVACEEEGVKVAAIVEELKHLKDRTVLNSTLDDCLGDSHKELLTGLDGSDPSRVGVVLYRLFEMTKTCIAEHGQGHVTLNNLVASIFGDIMHKLKCIHPESHVEVLCETFVNDVHN